MAVAAAVGGGGVADEWGEAAPPQCSRAETIKRAWLSATGTSATRSTPFRTLYPPIQPFSLSISRSLSALPTTHRHAAPLGATAFHSRRSLMSTAAALPSRLTDTAGENIRSDKKSVSLLLPAGQHPESRDSACTPAAAAATAATTRKAAVKPRLRALFFPDGVAAAATTASSASSRVERVCEGVHPPRGASNVSAESRGHRGCRHRRLAAVAGVVSEDEVDKAGPPAPIAVGGQRRTRRRAGAQCVAQKQRR